MINRLITKFIYIFCTPIFYGKHLGVKFGLNCYISTKGFSSEGGLISVGNNVRIAREVLLLTHGGVWALRHAYEDMKDFDYYGKISIGNNVYIGQRAIIMPGVKIGNNCVIGAATIVNKSIPDNSIVAGNPCKYITNTDSFVKKMMTQKIDTLGLKGKDKLSFIYNLDESFFIQKPNIKKNI